MEHSKLHIAVIGAGVAGLTTAHILQRRHSVTIFEKNDYLGGHTRTIVLEDGPDAGVAVDMGFVVLNDRTYPTFNRLLSQLGVDVSFTEMSFSFQCERAGLQYAGTSLRGLFAQPANLWRTSFLRMLKDIGRFSRRARRDLRNGTLNGATLSRYIAEGRFSREFVEHYVVPMGAAIWSVPPRQMMDFPAEPFIRFFENHGLLSFGNRPRWQIIPGGSHTYVRAFLKTFEGMVRTRAEIDHVRRRDDGVVVSMKDGSECRFDRVVLATHADEALRLLADPSGDERRWLGTWRYQKNLVVLHTDATVMPPNRRAWASWNYKREDGEDDGAPIAITYYMNRLQRLRAREQYFVTLNGRKPPAADRIIREVEFAHPAYRFESLAAQRELWRLNGVRRTYFCGSYFGYGFHEDAVKSGAMVARAFGLEL